MSESRDWKVVSVVFDQDDIERLDDIARRIAATIGVKRANRSETLRRMIGEFDVDAWIRRNSPQREAA